MIAKKGSKIYFETSQITAVSDTSSVMYVMDLPSGIIIDSAETLKGTDVDYQISGNAIVGIDLQEKKCFQLRICLKITSECDIPCPVVIRGQWKYPSASCSCDSKIDRKEYNVITSEMIRSAVGNLSYEKVESIKECFEAVDQSEFILVVPTDKTLDLSSVTVFANGLMVGVDSVLRTADDHYTVTTSKPWGSSSDPCNLCIVANTKQIVCRNDFTYEAIRVGNVPFVDDGSTDVFQIPPLGCPGSYDMNSFCVFINGVLQSGIEILSQNGGLEFSLADKTPRGTADDPCDVVVKYNYYELLTTNTCDCCGEDNFIKQAPVPNKNEKAIVAAYEIERCDANGDLVKIQLCKMSDGTFKFTLPDDTCIVGQMSDLSEAGYTSCGLLDQKSFIDAFIGELTSTATKSIYEPSEPLMGISVVVTDPDRCSYIRVTYLCPDGTAGCSLITPTTPTKSLALPKADVTSICFEAVEKTIGLPIKDWPVKTVENPVEISVDGLA